MENLRPDRGRLFGPEGSMGGAALDRALEALAQAGLANRRRVKEAEREVRRTKGRPQAFDEHRRASDQRSGAAL
eukprot:6252683-Alexandrium_andersonii.AAC.1